MRPARPLRDARFYASYTDLDAKSARFHAVEVTKHNPASSMHIAITPWLAAFCRTRQQHQALDLFHFWFGWALDHPMHTNTRSLKKCSNTHSLDKLADVIWEALHLRFVLDNMYLACEDSQIGLCPISVLCDPLTW